MDVEDKKKWYLERIELKFNKYGEDEGKYSGFVTFSNGSFESFRFKVYPEMADRYIQLIAQDVAKGAESLGNDLIESLNLKERQS